MVLPGSGAFVAPEAQSFWLGQPWHGADLPACSLVVPGQSNKGKTESSHQDLSTLKRPKYPRSASSGCR